MKKVLVLFIALTALFMFSGCIIVVGGCNMSNQHKAYKEFDATADCGSGKKLVCNSQFGEIIVSVSEVADQCSVHAKYFAGAGSQERAEELLGTMSIAFDISDDQIKIEVLCPDKRNNESYGADIEIKVPASTITDLNTSYGKIEVTGLTGDCRAVSSFAAIEVSDIIGELNLNTSYGDVKVKNCQAEDMRLHTSFSGINVKDSKGDIEALTSYGNIKVEKTLSHEVRLNTSFSDINYKGLDIEEGFIGDFNTSYGHVSVSGMKDFTGKVEMSTSYGEVKTDLPITVQGRISQDRISGKIADGKGSIKIVNSFGNIDLK